MLPHVCQSLFPVGSNAPLHLPLSLPCLQDSAKTLSAKTFLSWSTLNFKLLLAAKCELLMLDISDVDTDLQGIFRFPDTATFIRWCIRMISFTFLVSWMLPALVPQYLDVIFPGCFTLQVSVLGVSCNRSGPLP